MKRRPAARRREDLTRYMELVARFPLRPLRGEADYDAAVRVLDELAGRDDLDAGEADYLAALTRFVEDYDDGHYTIGLPEMSPLDALNYLMQQRGLSRSDLGRILGSASAASMVLNGQRELSKAQIAKLAAEFKVDAGLFIERPVAAGR